MLDSDTRPERRTAMIAKELLRYNVDIVALQETRLEAQGQITEKEYTFFWVGKPDGRRNAGVAFAVNNRISRKLPSLPTGHSERLLSLRIPLGNERHLTLINIYAPTMAYSDEEKETFYQELSEVTDRIPQEEKLVILGDFNARVGKDHVTYKGTVGKFGKEKINANGERMLSFCTERQLCVTNTFFKQPDKNYFTWKHPRSKHLHLLDYVVTRTSNLSEVLSTKAMRGAECSTDHFMVRSKLRLKMSAPRHKTPSSINNRLEVRRLEKEEVQQRLASAINSAVEHENVNNATPTDIEERWQWLKNIMYSAASEVVGKSERKTPDWFLENEYSIQELIEEKHRLLNRHLKENTERSKAALKEIKAKIQRETRAMKDNWWCRKADEMQKMADMNDSRGLFSALKSIYGPRSNAVAPVKSADGSQLYTNLDDIQGRWKEHFQNLLNQEGTADQNACQWLQRRSEREELCEHITMDELEKAMWYTRNGKAPGQDGIAAEVLKHGGPNLKVKLLELFNTCLDEEALPQDFKDALIVTIYKKKGDRGDCGNHRGISLLSIAGKILAKIVLNRIKTIAEDVLPESQCGFRAGRSTTDMIFTLRQLQEKAREQCQPLYVVFVDFSKAFDTVDRQTLWKVLELYGCPDKLVKIIRSFHDGMVGKVTIGGSTSDTFAVNHGVKQGCVLAPTLFTLYLGAMLETMSINLSKGVYIRTRSDGKLFNLARLKAHAKTREICVRELLYADDSALVATDQATIQEIMNRFSMTANLFGLKINASKTELLLQPSPTCELPPCEILVNGEPLKNCESFTYLGSAVTNNNSSDLEVERRITAATRAFGALQKRLWSRHEIKRTTKVKVYNTAVLPALLYSVECMTLYRRHIRKLTRVQLRHLRQIMGIRWQDKIADVEVLKRAETVSVEALITASQLRWAGHVWRMPENRLPKTVMYGELSDGKRKCGGQKLRYKDVLKRNMKKGGINDFTWERQALERVGWRGTIRKAVSAVEEKRQIDYIKAHERRHCPVVNTAFICPRCQRRCRSRAGLMAHMRFCS